MAGTLTGELRTVGVVGAGVMGAGIAQLSCLAGFETILCDASTEALDNAAARIARDLERGAERARWTAEDAERAHGLLRAAHEIADVRECDIVIEAVPEDMAIKSGVLGQLASVPVVATNTSSLSVTAIAALAPHPERVVGMHFFNPPPLMRLVEIVRGAQTSPSAVAVASTLAQRMGRVPISASDSIGFVANRCGRAYYMEALALVDEGVSDPDQIDRLCRLGAGFKMGPFELMDLVGTDTGLAVAESFTAQSGGEPRWKPGLAQRRLVASGRLGRKSGRGWYDYSNGPHRSDDPSPPGGRSDREPLVVLGESDEAEAIRSRAADRGFALGSLDASPEALVIVDDVRLLQTVSAGRLIAVSCAGGSLASSGRREAVGFHILPPPGEAVVAELTRLPQTDPQAAAATERWASALGLHSEWVDDAPGLVLGRIVCQTVNEACFAVGEAVASPADIDTATTLGLNHPHGPIQWGERVGWGSVLDRIDGLFDDRHDPRYRAAPLLRRAAATGISVRHLAERAERWI